FLAPGRGLRIDRKILNACRLASAHCGAGGAPTSLGVSPGHRTVLEIALFQAAPGYRADALLLILLDIADPGHAIAGLLAHDPTDIAQERRLILRAQQDLQTAADGSQLAVQAGHTDFAGHAPPDLVASHLLRVRSTVPWVLPTCLEPTV